eukprot:CAMPEP_0170070240 /NCGR_PEP_ID=MMETSP0019_2-20121128/8612_1 /TAXON_ID=98059 /ORGANISM="Dinobryon sp., Strain UTEXLB2267" /LENGTH=705 /DNA_ID=CAMNT_0010278481 /DNA_START=732 /DNA_END=2849 /DNA_ORIENTATION=-
MLKKEITSYKSYYQYLHALDEFHETGAPQIVEKLSEEGLKEIVKKATLRAHRDKIDDDVLGTFLVACVNEVYLFFSRLAMRVYMTCVSSRIVSIDEVMQRFGSWDENDVDGSFLSVRSRPSVIQQQQQPHVGGRRRVNSAEALNPGDYYSLPSFLTDSKLSFPVAEEGSGVDVEGDTPAQPPNSSPMRARARTSSANIENGRHSARQSLGRGSGTTAGGGRRISTALSVPSRSPSDTTNRRRSIATLANTAATAAKRLTFQTLVLEVKGDHIKDLFWWSNPDLYFQVVRFFIMLIALYLALWLVDFTSGDVGSGRSALAILPGILSLLNYIYVVKTAALVRAMHNLDFEATQQVLNQTDGSRALEKRIRDALLPKLGTEGDLRKRVYDLFCEIDYNFSGSIMRQEFSIYLNKLGIVLNRKQWKETFRNIDTDSNESISFQEFFIFLYPEHRAAVRSERRRLLTISHRVEHSVLQSSSSSSSLLVFLDSRKRRNADAYTVQPTSSGSFKGDVEEGETGTAKSPTPASDSGGDVAVSLSGSTKRMISGFGRSLNLELGLGSNKECSKESNSEGVAVQSSPSSHTGASGTAGQYITNLPSQSQQPQSSIGDNTETNRPKLRYSAPSAKIEVQVSFLASARSSSSSSSDGGSSGNENNHVVHPGQSPDNELVGSRPNQPSRARANGSDGVAMGRHRIHRVSDGDSIISS